MSIVNTLSLQSNRQIKINCVVSEINSTNWKSGKKYGNIQKRSNPAEATHEERKIASLKKGARVP